MRLLPASVLVILVISSIRCGPGIGASDFRCETAMAHLDDCCPDFPLHEQNCQSTNEGCKYTSLPVLESQESLCIIGLSCDEIHSRGLCDIVPNLPAGTTVCEEPHACFDGGIHREPVCP